MNTENEILGCEDELRQAQLSGDVAALERLLDEALIFTSLDGTIAKKHDDLALHGSGRLRITKMEPLDRHILNLGDTWVVSVQMDAAAMMDGVPVAAMLRYTRVWHRRPEGWRVVAGHMSVVPA